MVTDHLISVGAKGHIEAVKYYLGLAHEDDIDFDQLMQRAFGELFIYSNGENVTDVLFQRWKKVFNLQCALCFPWRTCWLSLC